MSRNSLSYCCKKLSEAETMFNWQALVRALIPWKTISYFEDYFASLVYPKVRYLVCLVQFVFLLLNLRFLSVYFLEHDFLWSTVLIDLTGVFSLDTFTILNLVFIFTPTAYFYYVIYLKWEPRRMNCIYQVLIKLDDRIFLRSKSNRNSKSPSLQIRRAVLTFLNTLQGFHVFMG